MQDAGEASETTRYRIAGMDCASCGHKIDTAVSRVRGVRQVNVSVPAGTLTVEHDPDLPRTSVEHQVRALGYAISRNDEPDRGGHVHSHVDEDGGGPWWRSRKA